jgi:hypothetical protein
MGSWPHGAVGAAGATPDLSAGAALLSRLSEDSSPKKLRTVAGDIVREAAQTRERSAGRPAPSPNASREPDTRDVAGHSTTTVTHGPSTEATAS